MFPDLTILSHQLFIFVSSSKSKQTKHTCFSSAIPLESSSRLRSASYKTTVGSLETTKRLTVLKWQLTRVECNLSTKKADSKRILDN